uniref:Uncharacterized protein n=1 Tax=Paramoeba aestuarina TaxID=180227 RepID=A0A7S4NXS0_9EUKA|mmetsp:Transcript_30832/g.48023  ORF Transcript_30832/g.48023 Transcript_30832/m.48023 type:complete len:327 (+) Transcript_30832:165-1145(+)
MVEVDVSDKNVVVGEGGGEKKKRVRKRKNKDSNNDTKETDNEKKEEQPEEKKKVEETTPEKEEEKEPDFFEEGGQKIEMTKIIDHALRFALLSKSPAPTPGLTTLFSKYCDKPSLPVSVVFTLSSFLKIMNKQKPLSSYSSPPPMFIHQILEGATIAYDTPKPPPVDPVVASKLAELRARAANAEYEKMVRNVTQTKKDRWEKDTRELSGMFSQLSVGLNIIVSMATTLTAGYWIGKLWVAPEKPIIGIAIGVVFMVVVLMAEVWLFIFQSERLNKHLEKEKKEREKMNGIFVTGLPPTSKSPLPSSLPPTSSPLPSLSMIDKKKQ